MKLSKYVSNETIVNTIYSQLDYLNMISSIHEVSKPWYIKRAITNYTSKSNINSMLDLIDKYQKNVIEDIKKSIKILFRLVFRKYFKEELGLDNEAEIAIKYNDDLLELSVFDVNIVINYSSWQEAVETILNYDTTLLFDHKILHFISTLSNMHDTDDGVWVNVKRNGAAILCTRDGLSFKIKHSFEGELKYLTAISTGERKENLNRAMAIFNRC